MAQRLINSPENIGDNVIRTSHIRNEAVTREKLPDNAVNNDKLADNAVNTDQIVDEAVTSDKIKAGDVLRWVGTEPASATAPGVKGDAYASATYVYICVATNTWVRAALATW